MLGIQRREESLPRILRVLGSMPRTAAKQQQQINHMHFFQSAFLANIRTLWTDLSDSLKKKNKNLSLAYLIISLLMKI